MQVQIVISEAGIKIQKFKFEKRNMKCKCKVFPKAKNINFCIPFWLPTYLIPNMASRGI